MGADQAKRTTVDERDAFLKGLHRVITLYENSAAVPAYAVAEQPSASLFVDRKQLIDKITGILGQKQQLGSVSAEEAKELEDLQKRLLLETFKPLADKSSAELVSMEKIKGREADIGRINERFREAVEKIQEAIESDEQRHTAVKNGVEIAQEDILADFVNNRSQKLINFN